MSWHLHHSGAVVEVMANGTHPISGFPRTGTQGTLGALREILSTTPEIEMVRIVDFASDSDKEFFDPWSLVVAPEEK